MKNSLILLLAFCIVSCSKSETDFVGEYQTSFASEIKQGNSFTFSMRPAYGVKQKKQKSTAVLYYEPSPFSLSIFKNQEGKIAGEAKITSYSEQSFSSKIIKRDMSFDLKNIRQNGDTLTFIFDNEVSRLTGKSMKGHLVKNSENVLLALEKEFTGTYEFSKKSPFYSNEDSNMIYYLANVGEADTSINKAFYEKQISIFNDLFFMSKKGEEKEILENSIEVLEGKLNP